jgi:hypothetical protein
MALHAKVLEICFCILKQLLNARFRKKSVYRTLWVLNISVVPLFSEMDLNFVYFFLLSDLI